MRKCLRCGTEMDDGGSLQLDGFLLKGLSLMKVGDRKVTGEDIAKIKATVCPNCGEVSIYIDNKKENEDSKPKID